MAAALPLARSAPAPASRPRRIRFALVFAAAIGALSLLPYLLAYLWTPPGHHFAGFFFIADDATTYLAKMRQGADGSWLWNDPYTSEPHGGVFLFGFYLLFGHLAALVHLPLIAAYHLAGISGAIALVLAAERLCRRLLPPQRANLGLVLVVLGSGVGFLAQAAGNPAIFGSRLEALDLHLPELSGWYSILAIPHFAWATALIITALLGLLNIMEAPGWRPLALTAVSLIALTAIHPQMIPVLAVIWVAYRAVLLLWGQRPSWRTIATEAAAFAATLPLLAYNAWILFRDPTVAEWAHQWRHQAPGPVSLAVSLGLPLVLAIVGMSVAWRRRDQGLALMLVWPPLVTALLYLPNLANIQRRLLDALFVPIGILAAVGLTSLTARLRLARARRIRVILVTVCCFSSAIVLAIALRFASGAFTEAYINDDAWQAMQWLSSHHQADDRALSAPAAGQLLPAWAGVPVYVGHYSETLDYFQKIRNVGAVLRPDEPDSALQSFLAANRLTLLYWGPDEVATGFHPDDHATFHLIYRHGAVAIYRVTRS
ncbi:MAG: hypothetical protein QOJ33_972 [Chloroflexota bacterium]|jgi:hypothetical protein|nr:hypothetical protein [Chloroflexota bacterium]MEA2668038.1 hypothetical protein [Chloroflexota bacterium]